MSNLRDIVRRHIEAETIAGLSDFEEGQQHQILEMLRREGQIDRKVQGILDIYLKEIEESSPRSRTRKTKLAIYAGLNVLLTILIGYTVNKEYWIMIWLLAAVNIMINIYFIFYNEE
jgi:hypothetical protein